MNVEDEDNASGTGASSDGSDSDTEPELMVTTREKRATAGNRYQQVVAQEEPEQVEDDDVALLFAEGDEEDEEYNSDEGADDADMSSSDDDDQGPNAGAEDLEGERVIEKEAKAERAKKRKADMALTSIQGLKKKPKFDPTALRKTAPKPTKRKERVSWLPEQTSTTGRTSLRAQTIAHREETHAKLKVNEEQRLKMKAIREKREREREADAPKELTQADRLAEAERIERKNAKSLNRWETMERKRAEEQAAKLAALKDRRLEGAVLTWHSASHIYYGLKSERDLPSEVPPEAKKRGRKPKAFHEQMAAARLAEMNAMKGASILISGNTAGPDSRAASTSASTPVASQTPISSQVVFTAPQSPGDFLTGIHEYASQPPLASATAPPVPKTTSTMEGTSPQTSKAIISSTSISNDQPAADSIEPAAPDVQMEDTVELSTAPRRGSIVVPKPQVLSQDLRSTTQAIDDKPTKSEDTMADETKDPTNPAPADERRDSDTILMGPSPDTADSPAPSVPLPEVVSTRNLVVLDGFEDLSGQARTEYGVFFNNRKSSKPAKQTTELCPISGLPSRYRDPTTGIGYANASAYKKLQELKKHQYIWSGMLQCYVGKSDFAARGVPEGF